MSISAEKELEILNDHYKDTCERIRENVVLRDRLFIFTLVVIGLHYLQISDREKSSEALVSLLKEHAGFQLSANTQVITAILWFLLLSIIVRYFQANVFINRQYDYLHRLEEKFNELLGHPLISREGKGYLSKYPHFSNWTSFLYTWAFPGLLILTVIFKIFSDWPGCTMLSWAFSISAISFFMIIISTFLYLLFLHRKEPS